MKKIIFILVATFIFAGCKQESQNNTSEQTSAETKVAALDMDRYPMELQKVFVAHGGLDKWNQMQSLTFALPSKNGDEVHTVDLKSRKTLIETAKYNLGYDGDMLWIQQDSLYFQPSQAEFVYNLMFYFYAMPFVLADDGIAYTTVAPLEMNGISHPGIRVSYDAGIGNSSNDEYVLYYDPTTYEMKWLGYTVTYGQEGKSDRMSYINYNKWQEVSDFLLPDELTWFTVVDGKPTVARGPARKFTKVDIDASVMESSLYAKPETGTYVNKKQ